MVSPSLKIKKIFTWFAKRSVWSFQSYELFPHLDVLQNLIPRTYQGSGERQKEVTEEALQLLERVGLLDKNINYSSLSQLDKATGSITFIALLMHQKFFDSSFLAGSRNGGGVAELTNDSAPEVVPADSW